jgi:hypothetical protein
MLYLASGGGYVTTYRTSGPSLVLVDEIHADVRGHSVAYDPARRYLFLPGGREGRSNLLILKPLDPDVAAEPAAQVAAR